MTSEKLHQSNQQRVQRILGQACGMNLEPATKTKGRCDSGINSRPPPPLHPTGFKLRSARAQYLSRYWNRRYNHGAARKEKAVSDEGGGGVANLEEDQEQVELLASVAAFKVGSNRIQQHADQLDSGQRIRRVDGARLQVCKKFKKIQKNG